MAEGRVTKLERAAAAMAAQADVDALAKTVSGMASTSAVARVEGEVAAMAAASAASRDYLVDGVTDAAGAISIEVVPPLFACAVLPEGPQVTGKAIFPTVVRSVDADGRTTKVVFAFWEATTAAVTVSLGKAPAPAAPAPKGIACRFRVTGRLPA